MNDCTKTEKKIFLTALAWAIKKDLTTSIRKYDNKSKVHETSVRTAIKQNLSSDLNLLDYAMWGVLGNKTNATFNQNKVSEEFILKASKSFWRRVDTIVEKNGGHFE